VRTGWRLGVIVILFAGTAIILHTARPVTGSVNPVSLLALPATLGAWSSLDGVPEDILPPDPNEKLSVRRTYRNGAQVAWISVALFVGQENETRRASINKIYPQRSVSLVEPGPSTLTLTVPPTSPIKLPAVIIHQDSRRLLVAYWHQIGHRVYGNEYGFRLALMRELVLARHTDTLLIRIAVPVGTNGQVRENLDAVGHLAASLYSTLAPRGSQ